MNYRTEQRAGHDSQVFLITAGEFKASLVYRRSYRPELRGGSLCEKINGKEKKKKKQIKNSEKQNQSREGQRVRL